MKDLKKAFTLERLVKKKNFFNLGFNNRWQKILPENILKKLNANLQNELNELGYNN